MTWAARIPTFTGGAWTPLALGSSLYAWWDADTVNSIGLSGSSVTSWADRVAGVALAQSVSGSRPTYSATGLNGYGSITFDGVDDCLELASVPAALPSAGAVCEIWGLVNQTALAADATNRIILSYGGITGSDSRQVRRAVSGGTNRVAAAVGDGAIGTTIVGTSAVLFDGVHIARLVVGSSTSTLTLDGLATASASVTPSTATTRTRIGANTANSAGNFWNGSMNSVLVTGLLSASQAASLLQYLKTKGGVA